MKEYEELENTEEFVNQIERVFETVVKGTVSSDAHFNRLVLISTVGCLCTPDLNDLLKEKINELYKRSYVSLYNVEWYVALDEVENECCFNLIENISNKYVPLKLYLDFDESNLYKYDETLNEIVPEFFYGIVDFNKFIQLINDKLGYYVGIFDCENYSNKVKCFNDYLNYIIKESSDSNKKSIDLIVLADFNKNKDNDKIKSYIKK